MSVHRGISQSMARRLPARAGRRLEDERGSALLLLLILGVVSATVLGVAFSYISESAKAEKRSNVRVEGTYAAEYAFEQAYQQLYTLLYQSTVNLPTVSDTTAVTNLTTAPTSTFGPAGGYTWQAFLTVPVEGGVPVAAHTNFNPIQGVYKYLTVVEFTRTVPGMTAPVHMQFQREWDYSLTPLFQYAVFYDGDLELFPGAAFNVSGRVHSNGKIYTGTTASITFSDFVTDVSGISNSYSPLDPRPATALNGPINYEKAPPSVTTAEHPPGELNANTSDANHNNDGPHELIELPNSWETDANATDRLYNKAGLKVLVNSTAADVTADSGVAVPANSRVFMTADGTVIPAGDPLQTYLGSMMTTGSIDDYREGAVLTATQVDVSKVDAAYNAGGLPQTIPSSAKWPSNGTIPSTLRGQAIPAALQGKALWNGILYVTDVTNSATHRAGIELVNGGTLPDGSNNSSPVAGLTVATNNAAYIVGDYNTGGTPPVDSGSSLTANNYASGYTVQPAAVIADAVTVVSSNWTAGGYDSKSSLSQRPAANTTVNTALISGNVPSNGSAYSGGVENYIRLLENWSGKRLTYYGSMINVFASQQSTAPWQNTGIYYNAPQRNWYFDTNFLDPNKLPPGTPVLRSLQRGQWVQVQ